MNERIRQLAEQANDYADTVLDRQGKLYGEIVMAKFAQLIVKECMDVAKYHTPDTEECEHTWLIHDKIKEHFGVEE